MTDKVIRVLVAEQMSLDAMHDFARSETEAGRPTFVHDGDPQGELKAGLHFIYKPELTPEQIKQETADGSYFGVMVRPKKVDKDTNVEAVVRVGTNPGNLKDWWLKKQGRIASNTPAQNAVATAEYSVKALMRLVAPTDFDEASKNVLNGTLTSGNLSEYTNSREMNEKTVLIAGMGDIGIEVAKRLKALGVNVIGWGYQRDDGSHSFTQEKARKMGIGWAATLEEGIAKADAVTIHVKGEVLVLTKSVFDATKPGLKIVNAARAACIDIDALGLAIENGRVTGLIVDADSFPGEARDQLGRYIDLIRAHQDKGLDLLVTPHFAGDVTVETNYKATMQGIKQIAAAVLDKRVINPQGFSKDRPAVPEGYTDGGVEKPKGVGEIEGMTPSPTVTGIETTKKSQQLGG